MATITLSPELERAMTEQARRQGTTLEILALDKLNASFLPAPPAENASDGETMADFLKDFIGCIDSREVIPGGPNMSEYTGRKQSVSHFVPGERNDRENRGCTRSTRGQSTTS